MEQNLNLSEVFSQRVFHIPDYQRGYAWENKELSALWDDLDETSDSNRELKQHYTGNMNNGLIKVFNSVEKKCCFFYAKKLRIIFLLTIKPSEKYYLPMIILSRGYTVN
jgi:uncharacterized protein with ParB-like and HNH nuclease domain